MKKHSVLLFLFALCACELIVDVDVPFEHAQLTVNSFFNPDSVWKATVSINRHILDDSPIRKVENAELVIYEDTFPVDTLIHQSNGNYSSDEKPVIGKNYDIRVSAAEYETVSAQSTIPPPAGITSFEKNHTNMNNEEEVAIRIKFNDDGLQENYYQIAIAAELPNYNSFTGKTTYYRYRVLLETDNPEGAPYSQYFQIDNSIFLKDILFNGKEAEIFLKSRDLFGLYANRVIVSVRTVTEEYFKYATTAKLQEITSGDPFAQPVNVYNNVAHGLGIFAGFSQSVYIYTNPGPSIKAITPMQGKVGDLITVSTENFVKNAKYISVTFAGIQYPVYTPVIERNGDDVKVRVPEGAVSGKIVLYSRGTSLASDTDFDVIQ
jgi:hypothetical protein